MSDRQQPLKGYASQTQGQNPSMAYAQIAQMMASRIKQPEFSPDQFQYEYAPDEAGIPMSQVLNAQQGQQVPSYPMQQAMNQAQGYRTPMNMFQEQQYQDWLKKSHINSNDDWREGYDMRGFYQDPNAQTQINPIDHQIHFTDHYKQPWHHTFSQESGYYQGNPLGAGQWGGPGRDENYYQAGMNGFVPSGIQP